MSGQFRVFSPRLGGSSIWLGAIGEILIVALGVLLAFGLNAWWVAHTARVQEQTHLRALVTDFEENVGVYGVLLEREELIVKSSLELLQLARTASDADPVMVRRLMGGVFTSLREEPALDAYQALVNSAGLTLIRDEDLRGDLAGFAQRATDPYSQRFSDQLYMAFTTRFVGRLQFSALVAGDGEPESYADLLGDPAFQEHLALRHLIERDVASGYRQRLSEAQSILEQLKAQLEP